MCHDLLPWGDGIDISVKLGERERFQKLGKSLGPEYVTSAAENDMLLKITLQKPTKEKQHPPAWLYIGVRFYDENATHIWEHHKKDKASQIYQKEAVFPVYLRPIGPLLLPCPRDTFTFLNQSDHDVKNLGCGAETWRHKTEGSLYMRDEQCKVAMADYPRVQRTKISGGVIETLKIGSKEIYSCLFPEPKKAGKKKTT